MPELSLRKCNGLQWFATVCKTGTGITTTHCGKASDCSARNAASRPIDARRRCEPPKGPPCSRNSSTWQCCGVRRAASCRAARMSRVIRPESAIYAARSCGNSAAEQQSTRSLLLPDFPPIFSNGGVAVTPIPNAIACRTRLLQASAIWEKNMRAFLLDDARGRPLKWGPDQHASLDQTMPVAIASEFAALAESGDSLMKRVCVLAAALGCFGLGQAERVAPRSAAALADRTTPEG